MFTDAISLKRETLDKIDNSSIAIRVVLIVVYRTQASIYDGAIREYTYQLTTFEIKDFPKGSKYTFKIL